MIVTKQKYFLENKLLEKLDLMIDRCSAKLDTVLLCDGDEGFGKTTLSVDVANYVAEKLGRPFSVDNIFFDIDEMINFACKTKDQVIIWDEAALGGLASEWNTATQKKLLKMLMVARKKRHFYIFNVPKFFRLNEYLVVDRAVGLMHVYSRDGKTIGRFCYFKNSQLEKLYYECKRKKFRSYKKHFTFHGSFPNAFARIIDEEKYDQKKDEAIASLTKKKEKKESISDVKLKYGIATLSEKLGITKAKVAEMVGISYPRLSEWSRLPEKYPQLVPN